MAGNGFGGFAALRVGAAISAAALVFGFTATACEAADSLILLDEPFRAWILDKADLTAESSGAYRLTFS